MSDISMIGVLARIPKAAVASRPYRFEPTILPGGIAQRKGKPVAAPRSGRSDLPCDAATTPRGPG